MIIIVNFGIYFGMIWWNIIWLIFCPNWSNHSETIAFCDAEDQQFYKPRLEVYQQAAMLKKVNYNVHNDGSGCVVVITAYQIPSHEPNQM